MFWYNIRENFKFCNMTLTNKLLLWKYENKFNFNSVSPAVLFCDSNCIVYSLQKTRFVIWKRLLSFYVQAVETVVISTNDPHHQTGQFDTEVGVYCVSMEKSQSHILMIWIQSNNCTRNGPEVQNKMILKQKLVIYITGPELNIPLRTLMFFKQTF